jgi:stage II sporulation SpoE-like protein/PAS domain-containing protein/ANTAR domain-containing protein
MAGSDIDQLAAELSGLREALRQRAIVEQATGLLAGRIGCGLSAAFDYLGGIARETDMPIAEASYLLLSQISPADYPDLLPRVGGPALAGNITLFSAEALRRWTAPAPRQPAAVPGQRTPPTGQELAELAELMPLPAFVLTPIADASGEITDFTIDYANAESRYVHNDEGNSVVGHTLLSVFPEVGTTGLVASYANAMRSGQLVKLDLFPHQGMRDGQYRLSALDIRAQRRGSQLLVTWRVHQPDTEYASRPAAATGTAAPATGWAEWNLYSDEVTWSYEMYAMHGRELADGPLSVDAYREVVHPEDLPALEGLLRGLAERGEDSEIEFRVRLPAGDIRHMHVAATAVTDPEGKILVLRAVFKDLTASRHTERELHAAKVTVERARREATLRVQRALLPAESRLVGTADYEIAVKYVSAEVGSKSGGDWYEARLRRDGSLFLAVGDVAGHGLPAAAGMARVNNALRGLSATGLSCDQMLVALNRLVCETEEPETIASVIAGTIYPGVPYLRWAQAGHPEPVLVRDGRPALLGRPLGPMLGADPDAGYGTIETGLRSGDMLLWYTDGLIDRDIARSTNRLLDSAAASPVTTAEAFLDGLSRRLAPLATGDDLCMLAMRVR